MAKKRATDQAEEAAGEANGSVNKSMAARDYMKAHPKAKPAEVAAALAEQGIEITANYVSMIKSKSKKTRRAVKEVVEKRGVGIPEIKAAMHLLKLCGGTAEAKQALEAAEDIRKVM